MTLPRSAVEVLDSHVVMEIECIDRVCLNVYQPRLQHTGGPSVGGKMDCMYWVFGEMDVFAICHFPDDASSAVFTLTVNASGAMSGFATPLITAEDIDKVVEKSPTYQPPGQ